MNKYKEELEALRSYGFDHQTTDLLDRLVSLDNYHEHITAKRILEKKGDSVLPVMHTLSDSKSAVIRKEAAKIMKHLADLTSIPVAIKLLDDVDGDIRWIAAETLIHIGRACIRPLLTAIIEDQDAYYLREGAHHVLARLIRHNDPEELTELRHFLLNGEYQEILPLKITQILQKNKFL